MYKIHVKQGQFENCKNLRSDFSENCEADYTSS